MSGTMPGAKGGSPPQRTLLATALFTLAAGAATYGVHRLAGWPFGGPQLAVLAFLGVLTAVLLVWQENALASDPKGFMSRFMAALALKLLGALAAVAVILVVVPRGKALPLALTFAALYLAFLAFSTVRLSKASRQAARP